MVKNSFLTSLGYQYHSIFKTMHCSKCQVAISAKQLTTHPSTHEIKLLNIPEIQKKLAIYVLNDSKDVNCLLPLSGGPPVEGLNIIPGFKCTQCQYSAMLQRSVASQFLVHHPHLSKMPVFERSIPVQIQHFFNTKTSSFFAVNPELQQLSFDSPYTLFLRNPLTIKSSTLTFPIKNTQDLHPLTVMTGWHNHVASYMDNKAKILTLVTLCALPRSQELGLENLNIHVNAYLTKCGTLAKKADGIVIQMLKRFPM